MKHMYGLLFLFGFVFLAACTRSTPVDQEIYNDMGIQTQMEPSVQTPVSDSAEKTTYTLGELQAHARADDCWTVIDGKVYDISSFSSAHPGGAEPILSVCGKDGTSVFSNKHGMDTKRLEQFLLGSIK